MGRMCSIRMTGLYVGALVMVLSESSLSLGQEPFADLLKKVPATANALVVIDVKGVHSSPIAVRDGWIEQHEAAYVKSPLLLPPESDRLVLASQLTTESGFSQVWELALVSLTEPLSLKSIARAEGGYLDPLGGMDAAWTPSDAYFVDLKGNQLGVIHPADRQNAANWISAMQGGRTGVVSEYLKSVAAQVGSGCQIAMGFDLANVVRPHKLREILATSEWTKDNPTKMKQWEQLFLGIQGATLKIMLGETARGVIEVKFAGETSVLGSEAKSVFLTALDNNGIGIDELGDWKISLQGQSVFLEGELNDSALRKIFSLLELPSAKFSAVDVAATEAAASESQVLEASLNYYRSISTLLDDLRNEFMTNRDARHTLAATFIERYARRIDRLPILNVDEELLEFGGRVSETLRTTSVASKQAGVAGGVRKSSVYGNYSYDYDGNGYYNYRSNQSIKSQISREEEAKALNVRFSNWQEVENSLSAVRKAMTLKYKVEF